MKNIILIGMPGAGKSTVGVVLAKMLCKQFFDTDLLIQQREGKKLSEIIDLVGADGFKELEGEVCSQFNEQNCVVATGGSAVYSEKGMANLKKNAVCIYLKADYETLNKRLGNLSKRGVVFEKGQTLADILAERTPIYEKYADVTVDVSHGSIEQTLDSIIKMKEWE